MVALDLVYNPEGQTRPEVLSKVRRKNAKKGDWDGGWNCSSHKWLSGLRTTITRTQPFLVDLYMNLSQLQSP